MSFIAYSLIHILIHTLIALMVAVGRPNADSGRHLTADEQIVFTTTDSYAVFGSAFLATLACSSASPATTTVTEVRPAAVAVATPPSFSWAGVFDLIGTGFPDGERRAVMEIARNDTAYTLVSLQGPPGTATVFQITGNRAHIVWNLGTDLMVVDLRGTRDSVAGEWYVGDEAGQVRGARRR
jgi:hypothetical protein